MIVNFCTYLILSLLSQSNIIYASIDTNKNRIDQDLSTNENNKVSTLAREAVDTCFAAYKTTFDAMIMDAQRKICFSRDINDWKDLEVIYTERFADKIMSQLTKIARNLSNEDKKNFWSESEKNLNAKLKYFCEKQGCKYSDLERLENYINNIIRIEQLIACNCYENTPKD